MARRGGCFERKKDRKTDRLFFEDGSRTTQKTHFAPSTSDTGSLYVFARRLATVRAVAWPSPWVDPGTDATVSASSTDDGCPNAGWWW
jgi:hypothetical protein